MPHHDPSPAGRFESAFGGASAVILAHAPRLQVSPGTFTAHIIAERRGSAGRKFIASDASADGSLPRSAWRVLAALTIHSIPRRALTAAQLDGGFTAVASLGSLPPGRFASAIHADACAAAQSFFFDGAAKSSFRAI